MQTDFCFNMQWKCSGVHGIDIWPLYDKCNNSSLIQLELLVRKHLMQQYSGAKYAGQRLNLKQADHCLWLQRYSFDVRHLFWHQVYLCCGLFICNHKILRNRWTMVQRKTSIEWSLNAQKAKTQGMKVSSLFSSQYYFSCPSLMLIEQQGW